MKQKLSITIEGEKIKLIEALLKKEKFRSKSHVIEFALNKFLEEENGISKFD
jgi:Arc/MetJ-type ribon-helix-helix transcriptional regulator